MLIFSAVLHLADKFAERYQGMRAEKTVSQYRHAARTFDKYLHAHGRGIDNLLRCDLDDFARWLMEADRKPNTVHNYVTIAKIYCGWAEKTGLTIPELDKPMLPKRRNKRLEILPDRLIPTYNESCEALIAEPFKTALLLLPMTGLRVTEMCTLQIKDVTIGPPDDLHPFGTVQLAVIGKGSKYRPVPMLSDGVPIMVRYLTRIRPTLVKSKWLFPASLPLGRIDRDQITKRLRQVKADMGIERLHPHLLRHTYGTILNEAGISGFDLAQIMGHSDIKITALYVHPVESRLLSDVSQLSYRKSNQ